MTGEHGEEMKDIGKKIEKLFSKAEWQKARQLIRKSLKADPTDHWLWTRLSTTYYETLDYEKALEISRAAKKIAPKCPLVLWDFAAALDMLGNHRSAISIWEKLLKEGVNKIASEECGEGVRWAKSLLNDCKYRIGLSYSILGDSKKASEYLRLHIEGRRSGVRSIYSLRAVKNKLAVLEQQRAKRSTKKGRQKKQVE
jgi:tetratricopeptide (TPR) repeat protein